jgi:hypothetical protein
MNQLCALRVNEKVNCHYLHHVVQDVLTTWSCTGPISFLILPQPKLRSKCMVQYLRAVHLPAKNDEEPYEVSICLAQPRKMNQFGLSLGETLTLY